MSIVNSLDFWQKYQSKLGKNKKKRQEFGKPLSSWFHSKKKGLPKQIRKSRKWKKIIDRKERANEKRDKNEKREREKPELCAVENTSLPL